MTFVALQQMPYDRVRWHDDGYESVHATGYGIIEDDGYIRPLFEDDGLWPNDADIVIDELEATSIGAW